MRPTGHDGAEEDQPNETIQLHEDRGLGSDGVTEMQHNATLRIRQGVALPSPNYSKLPVTPWNPLIACLYSHFITLAAS
jgi:hypothetical protein